MGQNPLRIHNLGVSGNLSGTGVGNRATGPDGKPYIQDMDDQGITIGSLSKTATSQLTIVTNSSSDKGVDIFDHGDTSNSIVELKGTASADGEINVNSTDGALSAKLFNESSRGAVAVYSADGSDQLNYVGTDSNGGLSKTADTDGNKSFEAGSDGNKRGFSKLYNPAGDSARVHFSVDSSDMGKGEILASDGTSSITLKSDSSKNAVIEATNSAGEKQFNLDTNASNTSYLNANKLLLGAKTAKGNANLEVGYKNSVISASYSNIYSTGSVIVAGSGHTVSGDFDIIAGGTENSISGGNFSFVGGGSGVDITGSNYSSSVGGENNNLLTSDYSFIGGGQNIDISGSNYAVSVGGENNDITGSSYATIGGGVNNLIDHSTQSFIGGGGQNAIRSGASAAALIGGAFNRVLNRSSYSAIGGGRANEVSGLYGFIGGGFSNIVSGEASTILGGRSNEAEGKYCSVIGGLSNIISGNPVAQAQGLPGRPTGSVIVGGVYNYLTGGFSTILGGSGSRVEAEYSFVLGRTGIIPKHHTGASIFTDGHPRVTNSSGAHTALFDFASGVYIANTNSEGTILTLGGGVAGTGAGSRITLGSLPYLLSGDVAGEADTLQTVTDRGNTTTNSIISSGPYVSGVSGFFSEKVTIGGIVSPSGDLEVSGSVVIGKSNSPGDPTSWLHINGYDEHGIELAAHGDWTRWRISSAVNGGLELYNTGANSQTQQVYIGKKNFGQNRQGNMMVFSTGSVLRAGHNGTSYPILDIGVQDANAGASSYIGDAYLDVRRGTQTPNRFHFKKEGEFIATGVSVSGDISVNGDIHKNIENSHLGLYGGSDTTASDGFIKIHGNADNYGKVQTNIGYDATNSKAHWTLTDSTELMTLKGNGYLGIGTTSPATDLDVAGSGLFSGNIGIGTSSPSGKLDVRGDIRLIQDNKVIFGSDDGAFAGDSYQSIGGMTNSNDLTFRTYKDYIYKTLTSARSDTDGTERFRITQGGDVGIGTASPACELDVAGSGLFSGRVGIGTSTPLTKLDVRGAISGSGDFLGTGIGNRMTLNALPYLLSGDVAGEADTLATVTARGASTTDSITTTQHISGATGLFGSRVGIGTNSPSYGLEVDSTSDFGDTTSWNDGDAGYISYNAGSKFKMIAEADHALSLGAGGVNDHLYIKTGGQVGIGTTNPAYRLHVRSTPSTALTGLTDEVARFESTDQVAYISILDDKLTGYIGVDSIYPVPHLSLGLNSTMSSSSNLTITSDGKVGIGSNDPNKQLTVGGSIRATEDIELAADSEIDWHNGNNKIAAGLVSDYSLSFQTYGGAGHTTDTYTKMFIHSSGNVGLGTTNPTARLQVIGDISGYTGLFSQKVGIGTHAPTKALEVNGEVAGTGAGSRITLNGLPYLLSGDFNDTFTGLSSSNVTSALGYTPVDPSTTGALVNDNDIANFISGVSASDVTGALGFNPITGVSSSDVTSALGYTPVDPSTTGALVNNNDIADFITGVSSSSVTDALGFTPLSAEADTLATVTARGASTTDSITTTQYVSGATGLFQDGIGINTTDISSSLTVSATGDTHAGGYGNNIKLNGSNFPSILFDASSNNDFLLGVDGNGFNIKEAGSDARLTINNDGEVGIGTNNPSKPLHVIGDIKSSSAIVASRAEISSDVRHAGDENTKLSFETDTIHLETNGSKRLTVSSDGNVGIGVLDASHKLYVSGEVAGTGAGSRITLNGLPYLLSGDFNDTFTGLSSSNVTNALGYTPVDPSTTGALVNDNDIANFITGINSSNVTDALGFTPLSAEADTLATVTARGASTTDSITTTQYVSGATGLFGSRVGIGTHDPATTLDVDGEVLIQGANAGSVRARSSHANYSTSSSVLALNGYFAGDEYGLFVDNSNNFVIQRSGYSDKLLKLTSTDFLVSGYGIKFEKNTQSATHLPIDLRNENGDEVGFYSPATNEISIVTDRTDRVRIDDAGNVGIGTDSPSRRFSVKHDNGTALNDVADFIGGGSVNDETQINVGNLSAAAILGFNNGNGALTGQYGYVGITGAGANYQTIVFKSNNVGIGTNSPTVELQVVGDISGHSGLFSQKVGIGTDNPSYALDVNGTAKVSSNIEIGSSSRVRWGAGDAQIIEGKNGNYSLTFGTYNGSALADQMVILSNGNVGIGVVDPSHKLYVSGEVAGTGAGSRITLNGLPYLLSGDFNNSFTGLSSSNVTSALGYTPVDPSTTGALLNNNDITNFITGINATDVTGALGFNPITGVSSSDVTSALGYTPVDPSTTGALVNDNDIANFISGVSASDVTGALGFNPITGVSSSDVTSALGYTPVDPSTTGALLNDNDIADFITGINSSNVTDALGYTPVNPGGSPTFGSIYLQDTIFHDGDTDNRIDFGTDTISFATAGTTAVTVASNSNVGIGTASPHSTTKLHVEGISYAKSGVIGTTILGQSPPAEGLLVYGKVGIGTSVANNNLSVYGNANIGQGYQGIAAPSNGLIVQGNVGIGTSSPSALLDVSGAIKGAVDVIAQKGQVDLDNSHNGSFINSVTGSVATITIGKDLMDGFNVGVVSTGNTNVVVTGDNSMFINGISEGKVTLASGYQPGTILRLEANKYVVFGNIV